MAAAERFGLVGLLEGPRQPALFHRMRELQMTALERFAAAYAITGLSVRVSQLAELDRRDDESSPSTPPHRGAHRVA